jgi:EAL domain-containing protein (putative c-di-GMP-specific phosphodiesterase class I)/FixJ family two-component response regulator
MIKQTNGKKQILLVDDDKSATQILTLLLQTRGYDVNVAGRADEVFAKVTDTTDLILLDLILPDQGGFEICRRLKENRLTKQIPIIILSAKLLSEDITEALYIGADDYLTKPFEYEELVARMEAVMRRGGACNATFSAECEGRIIAEIRKIITQELIIPFFQPIFLLNPFNLYGFEALTRPQVNDMLSSPDMLFKAALQYGFYQELEILSWRKAVDYAGRFLRDKKLFLNCNPYLVEGSKFQTIKSIFEKSDFSIHNVVLEITERSAISDFKTFYECLARYRECGFQFAVDDVGGGYASLEAIVETKPEVLKIDRHIITGLGKDRFKTSIVKFIVSFCRENDILSIAEGIETREDLDAVLASGVDAGQGYYLCKPAPRIDMEQMENKTISSL